MVLRESLVLPKFSGTHLLEPQVSDHADTL